MKTNRATYDPEDIESLMRQKTFDELYKDEREFVLQHISDEKEYEEIRLTLLAIELSEPQAPLRPRAQTKEFLLDTFKNQRTSRWLILLQHANAFAKGLFTPSHGLFRFGLIPAMVLALVIGGNLIFNQQQEGFNFEKKVASQQYYEEAVSEEELDMELATEEAPPPKPVVKSKAEIELIEDDKKDSELEPGTISSLEKPEQLSDTYSWHAASDSSIAVYAITSDAVTHHAAFTISSNGALDGSTSLNSNQSATTFGSNPNDLNFMNDNQRLTVIEDQELEEESEIVYESRVDESIEVMDTTLAFALFEDMDETGYANFEHQSKSVLYPSNATAAKEHIKAIDYLFTAF